MLWIVAKKVSYPFEPKSNAHLEPGQFWGIPLSDGRWACGRILEVLRQPEGSLPGNTRFFIAALMDWVDSAPPTPTSIAGGKVLAQGSAHVGTIQRHGEQILGQRDFSLDGIEALPELSHGRGGTVRLVRGSHVVRPATDDEIATLPLRSTWGLDFISVLAERHFVQGLPIVPSRPAPI
jgi:hypothetical protein